MSAEKMTDEQIKARRNKRSVALALALGGVVIIFYILTVVKIGPGLFDRVL